MLIAIRLKYMVTIFNLFPLSYGDAVMVSISLIYNENESLVMLRDILYHGHAYNERFAMPSIKYGIFEEA